LLLLRHIQMKNLKQPCVNFINILRTNFLYICCFGSFLYVQVTRKKLPNQHSYVDEIDYMCILSQLPETAVFPWGLTLLEYVPHICANPTPSKKISSSKILPLSFHSILLPFYSSCDVLIDERLKRRWVWLVRSAAKLCQGPEVNPIKKIKSFNRQNYSIISWRCVTSTKLLQWMI